MAAPFRPQRSPTRHNWHGQYIVGDASIRVTVTEDDSSGDDLYLWNYVLTNDPNNGWNFEMLAVPNKDPNGWGTDAMALTIGDIASDQEGWDGGPYGSPSRRLVRRTSTSGGAMKRAIPSCPAARSISRSQLPRLPSRAGQASFPRPPAASPTRSTVPSQSRKCPIRTK